MSARMLRKLLLPAVLFACSDLPAPVSSLVPSKPCLVADDGKASVVVQAIAGARPEDGIALAASLERVEGAAGKVSPTAATTGALTADPWALAGAARFEVSGLAAGTQHLLVVRVVDDSDSSAFTSVRLIGTGGTCDE